MYTRAVAAEYRCKYNILEGLLSSYSEAARTQRQLLQPQPDSTKSSESGGSRQQQPKKDAHYALEIFEEGRGAIADGILLDMVSRPSMMADAKSKSDPSMNRGSGTQMALGEAE